MRRLLFGLVIGSIGLVGCSKSGDGLPSASGPSAKVDSPRRYAMEKSAYPVHAIKESNLKSAKFASSERQSLIESEPEHNTNSFSRIDDNSFLATKQNPLSTFSIDVDTASYSMVRKFLNQHQLPPKDAVRIEELVNYFDYKYPAPNGDDPFSVNVELAKCPWNASHTLARIGLKGRTIAIDKRPPTNLVFLIDVSGSMNQPNRLPLVKQALAMMTRKMTENDRIAIVVYASRTGLALPSTTGSYTETILSALEQLEAGGSTNGGEGIQLAYQIAVQNYIKGGVNRVILATDGDFNVGISNEGDLTRLIEDKAKSGVFLIALGFGMGNYKDATLEKLANRGNGNYAYIDDENEAKKVLVEQLSGTLVTIAKDVKIQVEFNPARVSSYRLIGYENRALRSEDFNNDKKDAGEIGAGHTVTALYELAPAGEAVQGSVDPLKYQSNIQPVSNHSENELLNVKLRYKQPDGQTSKLMERPVAAQELKNIDEASGDLRFAAAVAGFGMLLRESEHKGNMTFQKVIALAESPSAADPTGRRVEFLKLVRQAEALKR